MKRFANTAQKVKAILEVFEGREKLAGDEIVTRLRERGYDVNPGNIKMFIRYHMLYKYLRKESRSGKNLYFLIS
jgi:repressor of nif and glnA expression